MLLRNYPSLLGAWLFRPGPGLFLTWIASMAIAGAFFGTYASALVMTAGLTLLLALIVAVAAFLPPGRPFREISALTARLDQLFRVATGAALFGAAAAFGALVGKWADVLPAGSANFSSFLAEVTWPIVFVTVPVASAWLGLLLASDLRKASRRTLLVAIGRLRRKLILRPDRQHPVASWFAGLAIATSNSLAVFFIGYFTPVILMFNVELALRALGFPSLFT